MFHEFQSVDQITPLLPVVVAKHGFLPWSQGQKKFSSVVTWSLAGFVQSQVLTRVAAVSIGMATLR